MNAAGGALQACLTRGRYSIALYALQQSIIGRVDDRRSEEEHILDTSIAITISNNARQKYEEFQSNQSPPPTCILTSHSLLVFFNISIYALIYGGGGGNFCFLLLFLGTGYHFG